MNDHIVGRNVFEKRLKLGMSRSEFAKEVDLSFAAVIKIETGKSYPREDTIRRMAKVLGCSEADLFRNDDKSDVCFNVSTPENVECPATTDRQFLAELRERIDRYLKQAA